MDYLALLEPSLGCLKPIERKSVNFPSAYGLVDITTWYMCEWGITIYRWNNWCVSCQTPPLSKEIRKCMEIVTFCEDWDVKLCTIWRGINFEWGKKTSGFSFTPISIVSKASMSFNLVEPTGKSHIYLVELISGVPNKVLNLSSLGFPFLFFWECTVSWRTCRIIRKNGENFTCLKG